MITITGREWNPKKERLLADGAWGTELMRRGLPQGDAPERMNADSPETIRELATEYMKAGSDIVLTNSFVGSRLQLERHGLGDRAGELNRKAAEIAASAAAAFADSTGRATAGSIAGSSFFPRPLVAGSIGPTGKLVVMGEIGAGELLGVFSQQAENLAEGGVDLILVESMVDLEEMIVAVRAGVKTGLPVVASMTYDKVKDGYRTVMGNTPEACVDAALAEGACIVGANCGTGIENYTDLAVELCSAGKAPVWIKANAGLPELVGKEIIYKQTADEYAGFIQPLLDSGVSIVGGCCGTSSGFVEAMRRELDSWLAGRYRIVVMPHLDIYGIGNPLIDIVVQAKDEDLRALGLDKGIMHLVDLEVRERILERVKDRGKGYSCGGSAPNTLIFLSALGVKSALAGKVGRDDFGQRYADNLPVENMENQLATGEGATGSSIILVTPDSERTMNTYLGANREFSIEDVDLGVVKRAGYLYFTGYMWDTDLQKRAVLDAIQVCRESNGIVAFDVADPFAVNRNRDSFGELIRENADIVFANAEEATLLFGTDTAVDAATALSEICEVAVVKDGAAGSLVKRKGKEIERIPVRRVLAMDTTGAGDMYAAGFLYGIISGMSDRESGVCASYLASRVVETWGAQFPPDIRGSVAEEVLRGKWRFAS